MEMQGHTEVSQARLDMGNFFSNFRVCVMEVGRMGLSFWADTISPCSAACEKSTFVLLDLNWMNLSFQSITECKAKT